MQLFIGYVGICSWKLFSLFVVVLYLSFTCPNFLCRILMKPWVRGSSSREALCKASSKNHQSILNFSLKFPLVFSQHMDSIHFILKFTGSTGLQTLIGNFFTSLMQIEMDTYLWSLPSLMGRFLLTLPFSRAQPWGPLSMPGFGYQIRQHPQDSFRVHVQQL